MKSVKKREAKFCNLKFFLIFLTVFAHIIEPHTGKSEALKLIYTAIYVFHMPAFAFLSGFFASCDRKKIICRLFNVVALYAGAQSICTAVTWHFERKNIILTPYFHLWYLLSLVFWLFGALIWAFLTEKIPKISTKSVKLTLFIFFSALSVFVLSLGHLGRTLSLSRTAAFFPFFLAGMFCPRSIEWKRYRPHGICALAVGAFGVFFLRKSLTFPLLWRAGDCQYESYLSGIALNAALLCIGFFLIFFLLTFMTEHVFAVSAVGADTTAVYVLHGFIVKSIYYIPILQNLTLSASFLLTVLIIGVIHLIKRRFSPKYIIV